MQPTIAKVQPTQFEAFLRRHGDMWTAVGSATFDEFTDELPLEPDEFVASLGRYFPDSTFFYVYSDIGAVEDINRAYHLDEAPEVDSQRLDNFITRPSRAKDFLYFAPTSETASNADYLTLLRWDDSSGD